MDKTMKPTEKVEVINIEQNNALLFVPASEQERFEQYLRTGMEPERAAFFCGIGSGRIDGDAEVDFSKIDPALQFPALCQ